MKLRKDFRADDGGDIGGDVVRIRGNLSCKARFLDEGAAFLKALGRALAPLGFAPNPTIIKSKGGPAVSGETWGYFGHIATGKTLFVEVGTSSIAFDKPRADRVIIMAQVRTRRDSASAGHNIWIDPNLDSSDVASELVRQSGLR